MNRYYLDTSIWIDIYEDRKGFRNEPLGEYGLKLLSYIKSINGKIILTDHTINELSNHYSMEQIRGMFKLVEDMIEKHMISDSQKIEAASLVLSRGVHSGDVLHAVAARNARAILVTRDKHFRDLKDISEPYAPEDLLP
jgi:predicted nucleic acid-binding protein